MTTTLWDIAEGQAAILTGYTDRLEQRYLTRLTELGFHPGERVVCMHAPRFGAPRVFRVSNSVFSIEDTIARCIRATRIEAGAAAPTRSTAKSPVTSTVDALHADPARTAAAAP